MGKKDRWQERFEKLIFILIEGAIIGFAVWYVQFHYESKDNKITIAKTMAESNFKEISHITNKRLFATKMLIENYMEFHVPKEGKRESEYKLDQEYYRDLYKEAVREWNFALGINPKILKHRFGKEFKSTYDSIHEKFKAVHSKIVDCKNNAYDSVCFKNIIDDDIIELSDSLESGVIDSLYVKMIFAIQNNEVKP